MPDIAHLAVDLTGHLPAAKASEVIESGRGRKTWERKRRRQVCSQIRFNGVFC